MYSIVSERNDLASGLLEVFGCMLAKISSDVGVDGIFFVGKEIIDSVIRVPKTRDCLGSGADGSPRNWTRWNGRVRCLWMDGDIGDAPASGGRFIMWQQRLLAEELHRGKESMIDAAIFLRITRYHTQPYLQ